MNKKRYAVLIDIDGTICDSSYALSYLNGERDKNNFATYYRTLDLAQPLTDSIETICVDIATCIKAHGIENVAVVFLTGRNMEAHVAFSTMTFLETHFKPVLNQTLQWHNVASSREPQYDYYFRPENYHVPSILYKEEKFEVLKNLYHFDHIYEDELSNVEMFFANRQEDSVVHWMRSSYDHSLDVQKLQVYTPDELLLHIKVHKVGSVCL